MNEKSRSLVSYIVLSALFTIVILWLVASLITIHEQEQEIDQLKFELWQKGETVDYYFEHTRTLEYALLNQCTCNASVYERLGVAE